MSTQFSVWLAAARLRTLPLSVAGIITGNAIAVDQEVFSNGVFILSLLTAIAFQIISNFANDYGDGIKGTDNADRLGPKRTLQQGLLTPKALKNGIAICAFVAMSFAIALIYLSLGWEQLLVSLVFLILAVLAVWAAIKYTVGDNAYGYSGFGDLFVFLFFGWVSVMGAYYLQTQTVDLTALFLGTAIGLMSVGVLNLNNMRDFTNDRNSHKNTLAVILGNYRAKRYHFFLIIFSGFFLFLGLGGSWMMNHPLSFLIFLPLLFHIYQVNRIKEERAFDPLLKQLALSTFFISWIVFIIFSIYR